MLHAMPAIRITAAADLLGVGASTLRGWEARHGFPSPGRSEGGHRQYDLVEVEALRDALRQVGDVPSAVELARRRTQGRASTSIDEARAALGSFDPAACDRLAESSMALRGLERTLGEVLLPGVAALEEHSAERDCAWRWTTGWLAAQARLAPPATREDGILLVDATAGAGDVDALHVQALELLLRRVGLRFLVLGADTDPARLGRSVAVLRPRLIVLGGRAAGLDGVRRLVWAARTSASEPVAVAELRGALRERDGVSGASVPSLGSDPLAARDAALALLDAGVRVTRPARAGAGA